MHINLIIKYVFVAMIICKLILSYMENGKLRITDIVFAISLTMVAVYIANKVGGSI